MSTPSAAKLRRGFTLLEVMVAAFLAGLILHVIISLLIPALKLSALGTTRVDLDGRATAAETRLIRALRATCRSGVLIHPPDGPVEDGDVQMRVLSTHPVEGTLADSVQRWANHLDVFVWQDRQLLEQRVPLQGLQLKATALQIDFLVPALANGERRFTITDVTDFRAQLTEGARIDFSFTLEKGKDKLEVQRTVFMVNSSQ